MRLLRTRWVLVLCATALAPTSACADKAGGVVTLASDLAYRNCPLYLTGSPEALSEQQLRSLGFTGPKQHIPNPRGFGDAEIVTAKLSDGKIGFGDTLAKLCMLIIFPDKPEVLMDRLRTDIAKLSNKFEDDGANSGDRGNGAHVETRMSKLDSGDILRAQLGSKVIQGKSAITFSIFVMDQ